jgi:outer membrane protein assembly factor BamB
MVYAASADGNLYALDAQNGSVQWTFQLNNSGVWTDIISTPAYYDSVIYVASTDQNIYAVNAFSGKEVWHYKTNSTYGQFVSSPLVADGTVYIAGFEPKFYALDDKTGKLKWSRDFPRDFYSSPVYFNNTILSLVTMEDFMPLMPEQAILYGLREEVVLTTVRARPA